MPFDPNAADLVVGLVGTGSMGRGIMQVAAQGGLSVIAFDEKPGAGEAAKDHMAKMLDGQVQKGRLPAAAGRAALDRVSVTDQLSAVAAAVGTFAREVDGSDGLVDFAAWLEI